MTLDELDVREVPKAQRHPLIFDRFAALPDQGAFVLVNSHDPKHLRDEFERDHRETATSSGEDGGMPSPGTTSTTDRRSGGFASADDR